MVKIIITLNAGYDLESIDKYIGEDNPERARTYTKELLKKFVGIVKMFPNSCPRYNKRRNMRRFIYNDYNVYYSYNETDKLVKVLHVIHSSQLINSLFLN